MEIETEQAVVESTDVQQEAVTEENNAQDLDLDSLLQEYSSETKTEEETESNIKLDEDSETKQLLQLMKRQMEDNNRKAAQQELNDTVKSIKGDIDVQDDFVKAYLNMKAETDPRLRQAYLEKGNRPKEWAKIEKSLRSDLRNFIGGLADKTATETREAVKASVLNSKSTKPSETKTSKDLAKMSDVEFEQYKQQAFRG